MLISVDTEKTYDKNHFLYSVKWDLKETSSVG